MKKRNVESSGSTFSNECCICKNGEVCKSGRKVFEQRILSYKNMNISTVTSSFKFQKLTEGSVKFKIYIYSRIILSFCDTTFHTILALLPLVFMFIIIITNVVSHLKKYGIQSKVFLIN